MDSPLPAAIPTAVAEKLPHEGEHLRALQRMQLLRPYYRWTLDLFRGHVGRRTLDAGCGIGNCTELLAELSEYVLAVDLSPENIRVLTERFADRPHVEVAQFDLDTHGAAISSRQIDTIVCFDVLEHIEDDLALLESFRRLIVPGGKLLVKVPAGPVLYGSVDVASGHFRRYTARELRSKAAKAGWEIIRTRYMNCWGVIPYFIKSRVLRRNSNFSRTFPSWQLAALRMLMPILARADRLIGPPIGQSVVLVARCPGGA